MTSENARKMMSTRRDFLRNGAFAVAVTSAGRNTKETGRRYYVNSADARADDSGQGSIEHPWKSLSAVNSRTFKPGDSIYFARGSTYSGAMIVSSSGVAGNPIAFSAYGSGLAPRFTNPSYSVLNGNMIQIRGSWVVLDGLFFHDGVAAPPSAHPSAYKKGDLDPAPRTIAAIFIAGTAEHVIVQNCEAINCPVAVRSYGEHALITRNYFHETVNRFLCSPDWGPVAIMLMVSNQEVSYNRIEHYYVVGGTWGADGGAIELDEHNSKQHINIHHNKAYDTQGFLETDSGGPYTDITIAYNLANVSEKFLGMTNCNHWRIDNNTVVRVLKRPGYNDANWFNAGTRNTVWRNNIFVLANGLQAFSHGLGARQIHDHNLYYSVDHSTTDPIPGPPGAGEKVGRPYFVDHAAYDFHLTSNSPAVDAGVPLGFKADLDGRPVPANKVPDMGAYEYALFAKT